MAAVTGDSKEAVALALFDIVRIAEGKSTGPNAANSMDRAYILSTYKACWKVANGGNAE